MNKDNHIELDKQENIFTGEVLTKAGMQVDKKFLKEIFFRITKSETEGVLSWKITNLQSSGKELYLNTIENSSKNIEIIIKNQESFQIKDLLEKKVYFNRNNEAWDYFHFKKVLKDDLHLPQNTKKETKEDEPININFDDLISLNDLFNGTDLNRNKPIDNPEKYIPPLEIGRSTKQNNLSSDKYHINFYQKSQNEKDLEEEEKQRKDIFSNLELEKLFIEYEESDQEREIKKNRRAHVNDLDSEFSMLNSDEVDEVKKPVKKIIIDDEEDQNLSLNDKNELNGFNNKIYLNVPNDKIIFNTNDNPPSDEFTANVARSTNNLTTPFRERPSDDEESITNSELERILEEYNNIDNQINSNKPEIKSFNNITSSVDNSSKLKSQFSKNSYYQTSQNANLTSNHSNLKGYSVNINIGGKGSQSLDKNNFMPVIDLNQFNSSNFSQSSSQNRQNIPYIRSSIKQRREEWQQSTKKFGGEWNSNGKRNPQRSENDFISAFKSKRLKKATDNKELQIELNTTCAICLDTINQLANLDNCSHDFCRPCIVQWSKNTNLCPLCKKEFKKIIYYEKNKKKELKVKKKKLHVEEEGFELLDELAQESADNCMVCAGSNDLAQMLVCDFCHYNVCHTYCDGLTSIPDNDWFCLSCRGRHYNINNIQSSNIREVDLTNEEDDEGYSPRILLEEEDQDLKECGHYTNDLIRITGQEVENQNGRSRRVRRRRSNTNIRVNIRVNVNMSDRGTDIRRNRSRSSNSNNQDNHENSFSIGSNLNNNLRSSRIRTRRNDY